MIRKIIGLGNQNPEHADETRGEEEDTVKEEGPFSIRTDTKVLDTDYDREQLQQDILERENDLRELRNRIRGTWKDYQRKLEFAKEKDGIDELRAKTRAKERKKAAVDGEQLYKLLWKELSALKNAMRKDEQVKIVSGDIYDVDLSDINNAAVQRMVEEHRSTLHDRQMMVEDFKEDVNRMEDEEIEIDFSDIEKDVAELEMQDLDVEFFVEPDAEAPELEGDAEWD